MNGPGHGKLVFDTPSGGSVNRPRQGADTGRSRFPDPDIMASKLIVVEGLSNDDAQALTEYIRDKHERAVVLDGEDRVSAAKKDDSQRSRSQGNDSGHTNKEKTDWRLLDTVEADWTTITTAKVTVATTLAEDGSNFSQWRKDLLVAAMQKGKHCCEALETPTGGTIADAAAQSLIRGSISEFQKDCTLDMESAHEMFEAIKDQYVGGTTKEAARNNKVWRKDLDTTKMKRSEKIRPFVQRKFRLMRCLLENGYQLDAEAFVDGVVLNLPSEFAGQVDGLANAYSDATPSVLANALERAAERIGWIDGVGPKTPAAVVPKVAAAAASSSTNGRRARKPLSEIKCWNCAEFGHFENRCPHPRQDAQRGQGAPRDNQQRRQGGGQGDRARPIAQVVVGARDAALEDMGPQGTYVAPRLLSVTNNVFDPGIQAFERDDWSADSGATIVLTNKLSALHEPTYYDKPVPIYLATNAVGGTVATGSLCFQSGGKIAWLHKVHCDPVASQNLLSVSAAVALGFSFQTNDKGEPIALLTPDGEVVCRIEKNGGLYKLKDITLIPPAGVDGAAIPVGTGDVLSQEAMMANNVASVEEWVSVPISVFALAEPLPRVGAVQADNSRQGMSVGDRLRLEYHERLGHLGTHSLDRLIKEKLVDGLPENMPATGGYAEVCETCIMGKGTRLPFPPGEHPATRPLQRLHMDTAEMTSVPGIRGELYFVTIICEFIGWKKVLLIWSKARIAAEIVAYLMELMNKKQLRVEEIQTDRGTEFINRTLTLWRKSMGIAHRKSCARTPEQNGRAERCIRTLKDMTRTVMIGARGSPSLWPEALQYVTFISNCIPVAGKPLTPHEALWGEKPNIDNIHKWGCRAYVRVHEKLRTGVLSPRFVPGMFVGLEDGTKGWRVRLPDRTTVTSREVRFLDGKSGVSDVDTVITVDGLNEFLGDDREVSTDDMSTVPMLEAAHPLWQQKPPAQEAQHEAAAGVPRRSARLEAQKAHEQGQRQALVTPCKRPTVAAPPLEPGEAQGMEEDEAEEQCVPCTAHQTPRNAAGEAIVEQLVPDPSGGEGVSASGEAAAGLQQVSSTEEPVARSEVLSERNVPPQCPAGPRRSERIRALQERKARQAGLSREGQREIFPDFRVEEGSRRARESVITDGTTRYHIPAPSKEQLSPHDAQKLAKEMCHTHVRECLRGEREKDASEEIPRHANPFEQLAHIPEDDASVSVDVTGYTGREHEVSEVDITGVTTQWSPQATATRAVVLTAKARPMSVQGVQSGYKSALKSDVRERAKGLHTRFSGEVTRHVYQCNAPERKKPWQCKIDRCERRRVQAKWRAERCGRRGYIGENVTEIPPESEDPEVLLARVNACHVEPCEPGEDVSDEEDNVEAWYRGSDRKESYDRSLFDQAATHPIAFTVTDGTCMTMRVPKTLAEAKKTPQWPYWDQACIDECDSIDKHGVKELVPRPRNATVLPAIWVLTPKFGSDGIIQRHKARLVAGGHRQRDGVDVRETFAPTALAVSRRCLLSYGAAIDYEIHQADIKTAFLHGDLDEEVYMEQPPGYGNGDRNFVWRLRKSLYGLKQAPRCWWIKLCKIYRK
jgi:hypothetical protein